MAERTLQTLIKNIKENLCLYDLPAMIADNLITERLRDKTLPDFSIISPKIEEFRMGSIHLVNPAEEQYLSTRAGLLYRVPAEVLAQYTIISITSVQPISRYGYGDVGWPYAMGYDAEDIISSVSDIKTMASIGRNISPALTFRYDNTRQEITVYAGWGSATYMVRATVMHDLSLTSLTESQWPLFEELAEYDVGRMIYNKVKRKGKLETPAGTFDLEIDDLSGCADKYKELYKELKEECQLDFEEIQRF